MGNDNRSIGGSSQGKARRDFTQFDIDLGDGATRAAQQPKEQQAQPNNANSGQASQRVQRPQQAKSQGNAQTVRRPQNAQNRNGERSVRQASQQRDPRQSQNKNGSAHDQKRQQQAKANASEVRRPSSSNKNVPPSANRRRKKKKNKGKVALFVTLAVFVLLGTSVAAAVGVYSGRISGESEHGELPSEVKTPVWEGADVISGLVCGLDYDNEDADGYSTEDKVGRTDMILYVRYDTKNNKATLMQIPRDTYVGQASELKDSQGNQLVNNNFQGKINQVYFTAKNQDQRMAALATVINQQFSLPVDFYVTIDMDALKEIVDIKGWIEVYVPMDIVDPDHPTTRLDQGWQNLTGEQVEFLLRNRYNPGYNGKMDIARLQTQQSFYSALFREFKTLQPKDLMMWMNVLTYRCKTDMSITQLGGLAQKALKIQGSDITFIRPSCGSTTTATGVSVISLVKDDTANLLNEYLRDPANPVPASELGIKELPIYSGVHEADVKTMADVQATEPAQATE